MNLIDVTSVIAEHMSAQADVVQSATDSLGQMSQMAVSVPADVNAANANGWGHASMGQFIGAGLAMIGAIGVGGSHGYATGQAAIAVGRNPEAQPKIFNTMLIGMAITESTSLYCFIIAILIIFVA